MQFTAEQTSFALLGALVALLIVLVVGAIFVATIARSFVRYAARFKGFQGGRNAKNEMTFSAVIDETPPPEPQLEPADLPAEAQTAPEALN